jgi:hypothetical protein
MPRTEREKRLLKALAATAAVAVVLVAFTMVFAGGGDSGSKTRVIRPGTGSTAPKAPAPGAQPSPQPSVAPLVFHGVDPFKPLASNEKSSSSSSSTKKAAPAPAVSPTQTPAGPVSAVVGGNMVTLVDIYTKAGKKRAHVDVDGTTYDAGPGDNFVDDYVLVSIADPCVQFAWRDQSFRLCVQPGSGG